MRRNSDQYGKSLFRRVAGDSFSNRKEPCTIGYGTGAASSRIDGVVGDQIAVEIESGNPKRIRGAVLDLLWHPYPAKLLVIVEGMQNKVQESAQQCRVILGRDLSIERYRVVVLDGSLRSETDLPIVRNALAELGWTAP
jgi:hypothetical protein